MTRHFRINFHVGFFLFALAACLSRNASAASFDCAEASSAMERAICSAPDLSKADEELDKAYQAALEPLSIEGQSSTRATQRSWLSFARKVCHLDGTSPTLQTDEVAGGSCLIGLYRDRQKQLEGASPRVGPFQFYEVVTFDAPPVPEHWGGFHDRLMRQFAYFQIDAPANNGQKVWNAYISAIKPVTGACKGGDHTDYPQVVAAGDDFISIMTEYADYCGGAHGTGGGTMSTRLLKEDREVAADDLFSTSSEWENDLGAIVVDEIKKYDASDDDGNGKADALTLQEAPGAAVQHIRSGRFAVGPKGLVIYFNAYEFGRYLDGIPHPLVIPWRKLEPYIDAHSPLRPLPW